MEAMGQPFPNPGRSDLDLLVEFQPIEPGALVQVSFGLEQQVAAITGNPVDLIEAGQAILAAVDAISLDRELF